MKTVAITQRVSVVPAYGERRDCLDQAWIRFLDACGLSPRIIPNVPTVARQLLAGVDGLVLTGGNDLTHYGGDAPERDEVETLLLREAEHRELPVIAVCRGMQLIQHLAGVPLARVEGHVTARMTVQVTVGEVTSVRNVNSYHHFAARESVPQLHVWARADDGVIKAVRHMRRPVIGIMWHPERQTPAAAEDMTMFRSVFGVS